MRDRREFFLERARFYGQRAKDYLVMGYDDDARLLAILAASWAHLGGRG